MKKLMLTTALASSLIASAALAELKVSGALEVTLGSGEGPSTGAKTNQGTTIGYENNINFSGGTKLDNGMEVKLTSGLEDSNLKDQSIQFIAGNTTVYIGTDVNGGNLDDGQSVPVVANPIEDSNFGLGVSYGGNKGTIHDQDAIGLIQKFGGGTISVAYAPKVGARGTVDSNPAAADKTGSGMAIGYSGKFEGLGILASRTVRDTDSLDAKEITATNIGLNYNFGNVTVGAQQHTVDDSNDGSSFTAGGEAKSTSIGAVFAATDAISVGLQVGKFESNAASKVDEDTVSLTVGYNLGGATITAQYTDVENKGGTAGTDGEAIELRIKQAY